MTSKNFSSIEGVAKINETIVEMTNDFNSGLNESDIRSF